ncbi:protein of unknown function (DUF397) [Goodfellowiella coeruleoviolacea]|uniref:DUF397 domain-containing protein n=1 Tax=Goodfellowiella coeruleoviolacea TaxID=334858 RepID=A0AAE3KJZ0_9PSEU|nr:protein of unknown function (DUF397) [Goodfellowiella coeruleoviolacea]
MTCRSSRWRKSSYSEKENCVEVAFGPAAVAVRDSKNVDGPVLGFSAANWRAFLAAAVAEQPTH